MYLLHIGVLIDKQLERKLSYLILEEQDTILAQEHILHNTFDFNNG